jgi:heavy metal translocating P-type ATPase
VSRLRCTHCGLPVTAAASDASGPIFCCYGCRLVSRIVGRPGEETLHAWNLLRLGIGAFLAMNVMTVSLLLYTGNVAPASVAVFHWLMLALATPAMILLVYPFAADAVEDLRRRRLSLDALIALGSLAAFAASAVNTFRGAGFVYYDTATMLPALVTFGKLLEATAKTRTGRLVRDLETLLPASALREEPEGLREVPLADLRPGDRLRVRPGQRFPADGAVIEGSSSVADAAFSGESAPRPCRPGDRVLAGAVNGEGGLLIQAEQVGPDILLQRIIDLVEDLRLTPSPAERLADRAAALFIPFVLVLAAAAGTYWFAAAGPVRAASVALAVIVVACPCALGIATPLATALAIGLAARAGILVRGGDVLERIGRLDAIFFDKTGTVTAGRLSVDEIRPLDPALSPDELLATLATLEQGSEHAVAQAILAAAKSRSISLGSVSDLQAVPGHGLSGQVTIAGVTQRILAGTAEFAGASTEPASPADPSTLIFISWGSQLRGTISLTDALRPDAAPAIAQLRALGLAPALLSGDRLSAAQAVARRLGLDRVEAPCPPDRKIALLRAAQSDGRTVAMVGDGLNDAPALAAADVGFALGGGTDLARQAGGVVLLSDRLTDLPWLVALSRRTRRLIKQNLAWAFAYNAVALTAAALGLLHPLLAALAMVVSSLTVLANSLRLLRFR